MEKQWFNLKKIFQPLPHLSGHPGRQVERLLGPFVAFYSWLWDAFVQRDFGGWPFIRNDFSGLHGWPSTRAWPDQGPWRLNGGRGIFPPIYKVTLLCPHIIYTSFSHNEHSTHYLLHPGVTHFPATNINTLAHSHGHSHRHTATKLTSAARVFCTYTQMTNPQPPTPPTKKNTLSSPHVSRIHATCPGSTAIIYATRQSRRLRCVTSVSPWVRDKAPMSQRLDAPAARPKRPASGAAQPGGMTPPPLAFKSQPSHHNPVVPKRHSAPTESPPPTPSPGFTPTSKSHSPPPTPTSTSKTTPPTPSKVNPLHRKSRPVKFFSSPGKTLYEMVDCL